MTHKALKIALLISAAAHIAACSIQAHAVDFSVGAEAGHCNAYGNINMCTDDMLTWHIYGTAEQKLTDHLSATLSLHHFSAYDGAADWAKDAANQSGAFNFGGIGIRYDF